MGVNLKRARFSDWLEDYGPDSRALYLKKLEKHIGQKIDVDAWQVQDTDFPRVGSYTSYGIFVLCLQYVTVGDYGNGLDKEEDIEFEALRDFRAKLQPGSLKVPYATHFLESGDTDTIFIPVLFPRPFVYDEGFVASLPGGIKALEAFAKGLRFELTAEPEMEYEVENGKWLPISTAKNVARILYGFFTKKPNACVALS
jgi:hypothetical protein